MKRFLAIIPLGVLAACAGLYLSPDDCRVMFGGHGGTNPPFDFGRGLVGTEGSDSPPDGYSYSFFEIKDCRSGQVAQVNTALWEQRGKGWVNILRNADPDGFKTAVLSREKGQEFEWILQSLERYGLTGNVVTAVYEDHETETCGCRVYYPELRGDKEPYEAQA